MLCVSAIYLHLPNSFTMSLISFNHFSHFIQQDTSACAYSLLPNISIVPNSFSSITLFWDHFLQRKLTTTTTVKFLGNVLDMARPWLKAAVTPKGTNAPASSVDAIATANSSNDHVSAHCRQTADPLRSYSMDFHVRICARRVYGMLRKIL